MLHLEQNYYSKILSYIFYITLIIFLIRIIIPESNLRIFFECIIFIFILTLIKNKKFIFNIQVFIFILIPTLLICLNEYIIHTNYNQEKINFLSYFPFYYFYTIILITLPTIIKINKIKLNNIVNLFSVVLIFSIYFNLKTNIEYNLNRNDLGSKIGAIIIYDYTITLLSTLTLFYSIYIKNNRYSYLLASISLFNIFLIFLHGSRGVWLGMILIISAAIIISLKSNLKKSGFILLFSSILISISLFIPSSPINSRINDFNSDVTIIKKGYPEKTSTGLRLLMLDVSKEQFLREPLIGVGEKELKEKLTEKVVESRHIHLHNLFTHELACHGILGLLGMIVMIFYPLYIFIFRQKNKFILVSGVSISLFTFVCGLTDYTFVRPYSFFLYSLIIIILLHYSKEYNSNTI